MRRAGSLALALLCAVSLGVVSSPAGSLAAASGRAAARAPQPAAAAVPGSAAAVAPRSGAAAAPVVLSSPATAAGTRIVAERRLDSRTLDLSLSSPAVERTVNVRLLLPPGWSKDSARTWPVLWLLHGGFDDYTSWTVKGDAARILADTGREGVLVVMPEASPCGWYSDWWNRGLAGPPDWETFHLTELRTLLERDYGAGGTRAIAGPSMGGFGAMAYAARHPGMFQAAASFSGALNTLHPGANGLSPPVVILMNMVLACGNVDWERLWGDPALQLSIWRAHNPHDLAEKLRGVRLYVASGDGRPGPRERNGNRDPLEESAHSVTKSFVKRIGELGIPATTHFYPGTHKWMYWQTELRSALPLLLPAS